jgi:hypothetical protein
VLSPRDCDTRRSDDETPRGGEGETIDESLLALHGQLHNKRHDQGRPHRRRNCDGPLGTTEGDCVDRSNNRDDPRWKRGGDSTGHTPMLNASRLGTRTGRTVHVSDTSSLGLG